MAQCHDYLDIKMVGVESSLECSYISSTCHLLPDNTESSSSWDYTACSWWLPNQAKVEVKGGEKKEKSDLWGKVAGYCNLEGKKSLIKFPTRFMCS